MDSFSDSELLQCKGFFLTLAIVRFRAETLNNLIWIEWKYKNIEFLHKTLSVAAVLWPPHVWPFSCDCPHTSRAPPIVEDILDEEFQLVSN